MLAAYVDLKKAFDSVHLIFAESLEVLVMALEALHEEAKPLGLEVSWLKTKVQISQNRADYPRLLGSGLTENKIDPKVLSDVDVERKLLQEGAVGGNLPAVEGPGPG
ncbi:hypothetical protein GWK47_054745 [Chionoecetes opilio]|uniref:Uncharacterized protein n=1 Tax=Chionoecetes opilio TaxID=41210 RepID=A0A8J4XZJ7_CHIOP|nr:hypothetical protein GWK47_054745 [Chionoecetes opilio]